MFDDHFKKRFGKIPFAIYQADYKPLPNGSEVLLHQHKEMELITVTEGCVYFFIHGEAFLLQEGDSLLIPPYALHRASVPASTTVTYLCVCFDLKILYDQELKEGLENGSLTISPLCQNQTSESHPFSAYISSAFYACQNHMEGWEFASVGYISLLFFELKNKGLITPSAVSNTHHDFCMRVMDYITQNYQENISSRSVADHLYINNSYFCRLFRKNFGINFSLYLQTFRLEEAKKLLKYSKLPISDIASAVGFSDFSYFSKIFKRDYGLTPSEYRKTA
jgi:AraC-like DNA-binding protein